MSNHDGQAEIVVAGYTSKLQVLDVGINKLCKDNFRQNNVEFLINRVSLEVKPKRQNVAHWLIKTGRASRHRSS
jgi:hypothetical protein